MIQGASSSTIHVQIKALLELGHSIISEVSGRKGKILEVDLSMGDGLVVVKTKRGRGATTFMSGDEVSLQRRSRRVWVVVNCPILPAVSRKPIATGPIPAGALNRQRTVGTVRPTISPR